jgi:hypothetical protein
MIGGCMKRIVALVLVVVIVAAAWLFREPLRTAWRDLRGAPAAVAPSQELAASAERKLSGLRDGSSGRATLTAVELESLLLFRYRGVLPAFLDSPSVELRGDQLRLRARVPIDKLPRVDGLSDAAAFLPDTAELTVAGKLLPLDSGRVAFGIDQVSAARFPLPGRLVPGALTRLGRRDEPGLPADAMALPLPPGAATAYIRRDSLVLLSRPTVPPRND